MYLVGLVVVEHVLVFEPDDDWEREKIFAYEVIEIARQDSVAIKLYERPIRYMRWNNKPPTEHKTQTIAKIIYVRLKVTISLYLNPNNIGSVERMVNKANQQISRC